MEMIKALDMRLGDTVRPVESSSLFMTSVVKTISADGVTLFRPYASCISDIAYIGNKVICMVGIEEYTISMLSQQVFYVERRSPEIK